MTEADREDPAVKTRRVSLQVEGPCGTSEGLLHHGRGRADPCDGCVTAPGERAGVNGRPRESVFRNT